MEKTTWTQNYEKTGLWSNTCELTHSEKKEQAEDSSYPKGIEVMLRETARKSYPDPENIGNPMIAPQDYDIHHSGRVLELFRTKISGYDPLIFPGTLLLL